MGVWEAADACCVCKCVVVRGMLCKWLLCFRVEFFIPLFMDGNDFITTGSPT